jgi:hypothetical protein
LGAHWQALSAVQHAICVPEVFPEGQSAAKLVQHLHFGGVGCAWAALRELVLRIIVCHWLWQWPTLRVEEKAAWLLIEALGVLVNHCTWICMPQVSQIPAVAIRSSMLMKPAVALNGSHDRDFAVQMAAHHAVCDSFLFANKPNLHLFYMT